MPPNTKIADLKTASVQDFKTNQMPSIILQLALAVEEAPPWGSNQRDPYLREFWKTEPFLAGAIYSVASRNAAFRWEVSGPPRQVRKARRMLNGADFGDGWQQFVMKISVDLLTCDNGAFVEIIRPARVKMNGKMLTAVKMRDEEGEVRWFVPTETGQPLAVPDDVAFKAQDSPMDAPIGIAHLDAGRCTRTGDPEYPVLYRDRNFKLHRLAWWQVIMLNDMQSPELTMNGVGLCAVSRMLRQAQTLRDIAIYRQEKVSGRFSRALYLTNVDADAVQDAIAMAEANADSRGLTRYMQPIIAQHIYPEAPVSVEKIELASLPEGFNEDMAMRWYIAVLALNFGVDYGFLAPLPGQGLGTATQSEVQARHARSKSSKLFMADVEGKFKSKGLFARSTTFHFKEVDPEEEQERDEARRRRAETRAIRITSLEISPAIARQIAHDDGDLDERYLEVLGETDITPEIMLADVGSETQGDEPEGGEKQLAKEVEKLEPRGEPLPEWDGEVDISEEDVQTAIERWRQNVPPEFSDLLEAEEAEERA